MGMADPNVDGPYATATIDDSITVPATTHKVPIHCVYPTSGPTAGPYPVIVVAHCFQIAASEYASYVTRLASFGYVALTADYPAGFTNVNNVANAEDLLGALDWTATASALVGVADPTHAGMTGHSMGGELALLAATMDPRVVASITIDPVDGAMSCAAPADCPDVSSLFPLAIPTGFVGETTDATASFMACAPAADNYDTFTNPRRRRASRSPSPARTT
jgi:dienelactone hydrolase